MDRKQIIEKIAERSGKTKWAIRRDIKWAEKNLGVSPKFYYKNNFEQLSHIRQTRIAVWRARLVLETEKEYDDFSNAIQKDVESIKKDKKRIAKTYKRDVTRYLYSKYGLWKKNDEELQVIFAKIDEIKRIKETILEELAENYDDDKVYDYIQSKYEDIISIYREFLDSYYMTKLTDKLVATKEFENREDELEEIALDMEATRTVFDFKNVEYIMYQLYNLKIKERLKFLSWREKTDIFHEISTSSERDILDNKSKAYDRLKEYYGREAISIESRKDFRKFKRFVKKHRVFCFKPMCGSLGRAIKKMSIDDFSKCKEIFKECIEKEKLFILEEMIVPSKRIYDLNPDSVNTVRVIVCRTEKGIVVDDTFMKVGRKGSFVDNGGAGGIFVHIDKNTGCFDSDGVDEMGIRYKKHPETGIIFQGYQLPDWEKAISLSREAAKLIPELPYIGWDITHTKKGWIIIEGNAQTTFLGRQATVLEGKRTDFLNILGYKNVPPSAFNFEKIEK